MNYISTQGKKQSTTLQKLVVMSVFWIYLFSAGKANAQSLLFQQNFSSSTNVNSYVSATPNNGQFTDIDGGNGTNSPASITGGALTYGRGNKAAAFTRTADFSPTPQTMVYSVDISVSGNTAAQTTAAIFRVGSGFGDGTADETNADSYAKFGINFGATSGTFSLRDIIAGTNSSNFTGTQRVIWILNNSGSTLTYNAPGGGTSTVANDKADLYVGNTLVFNEMSVQTTTQIMTDLKFVFNAGTGSISLDNFLITEIPLSPTAVELMSFGGTTYANSTYLNWQTGYEIRSLGFNLYREVAGKRERVNRSLIAGSALMAGAQVAVKAGFSYSWVDSMPAGKVLPQYWLEDTDLNGKVTLHGPIQPTAAGKLPPQAQALLLSHLNADGATARQTIVAPAPLVATGGKAALSPNAATDPLQTQWNIAVQPGVKLRIRQTGWYRVTQPELAAAGLDVSRDPRFLQLYTDAQEIPIIVNGGAGGRLGPADSIEFFGRNLDLPATDLRTYYLYFATAPGQRIPLANGQSGPPTGADSFSQTIERKERSIYFAALKNGDAENWFGPIITASPVDQSLNVQHLEAAGKATLEIALQGVTDVAGGPPDHNVHVLLNGNDIGALVFDGQAHYVTQLTISAGQLQEGNNVVTLTATGGDMDVSLIDYVRLTYAHRFTADNDALGYTATGREMVQVGGFTTSSLRLLDVTDPNNPTEVQGQIAAQAGGYAITAAAPGLGQRSLYAFAAGQVLQATGVLKNQPSSWNRPNQGATALIITHRDFLGSLDPLVTLRKSQGYSVSVIDVEDIYDEFSYGARSNQAIKDFLQRTKSAWKKAPRSVLLVGDASIDPRDYLGLGDHDFVPTKTVDAATTEAPSDDALADFNNDGVAEFAVGRLPVRTPQEAATMVAKIIEYERGGALEGAVVVADINDGFDFEATSHTVEGLLPGEVRTVEIFRSQLGDAGAHQAIITAINRGPKIVNYVGHGSFGLWRGNLLTNNDMALLNNRPALPLVISMTCLNGLFNDAYGDSLAEALLKAEAGGAIAVWSSSALTDPAVQALLNQEAIRQLFIGAPTLGDAMKRAKSLVPDGDVRRTWNLLGDPLTRLH